MWHISAMADGSEEWALNFISKVREAGKQMDERRDEFAQTVEELAAGMKRFAAMAWLPKRDSPAWADLKAPDLLLGAESDAVLDVVRGEVNVNLLSTADQLRGFAALVRAEVSVMGGVIVARGVFEACVFASALIDPTVDSEVRIQRALTRRLARLSAGIRIGGALGGSHALLAEDKAEADADAEIRRIVGFAQGRGWKVRKGRRADEIGAPLTIDWLVENLEHRVGIGRYAWTSSSSMAHGEHAADTAQWIEMSSDFERSPAWLTALWSTGIWAGPHLFLKSREAYMGRAELVDEFVAVRDAWEAITT
jgi:hypothetical protein